MDQKNGGKKPGKLKQLFLNWVNRIDRNLEEKAKTKNCCCKSQEQKGSSCCS